MREIFEMLGRNCEFLGVSAMCKIRPKYGKVKEKGQVRN